MDILLHLLLFILLTPALLGCAYLLKLTLLSQALPAPVPKRRDIRFDILIPAHNEAQVIARTLASLQKLDWPATHFRIIVIADNCSDDTAEIARAAGVTVIERQHDTLRGKGHALEYGIAHSSATGHADAVVVIDADTEVSANLLSCYAARLEQGAQAIQAHYGVLNPDDTWRTRLITIAYSAFHAVRSRARERLGVSCGLRGNGMCFTHDMLRQHPPQVYSLAEDVEYGILLGLNGIRVHYADEAQVLAELPTSRQGADSQRQRWEKGRFLVMRSYTGRLLIQAWRQRSAVCLDLAMDLLTLPLGYLALDIVIVALLTLPLLLVSSTMTIWLLICALLAAILSLHIFRGWQLCPLGPRALLELLRAPFFIAWKILALLRNRKNRAWVRTERNKDK